MASYTEVAVCEMALHHLGISRPFTNVDGTIAAVTDTTAEQRACEFWYAKDRDTVLTSAPWTFARAFVLLVLADDGTDEIWDEEWENAYTYPSDCLKIRRFVNNVGQGWYQSTADLWDRRVGAATYEWPYVIRQHAAAKVIMTDVAEADANIEYTKQVTDATLFDDLFVQCLSHKIASNLAITLAGDGATEKRNDQLRLYAMSLAQARASMRNEELPHDSGDGEIVRSRGGD